MGWVGYFQRMEMVRGSHLNTLESGDSSQQQALVIEMDSTNVLN